MGLFIFTANRTCILKSYLVILWVSVWWPYKALAQSNQPTLFLSPSRPDTAFLWFLMPFKAIKNLICNQYFWLTIKLVVALLLVLILGLFIYSMPGYMAKKLMGVWERGLCPLSKIIDRRMYSLPCFKCTAYFVFSGVHFFGVPW